MADKLLSSVAQKLLSESLQVKKGETVTVETWNTGLPLALEVVKQARRAGCLPVVVFEDEDTYVDGVKSAPKDVLGLMGKHEYGSLSGTDAYVFIPGPPLGPYYSRITREEYASSTKYNNSWYEAAEKAKLRGVRLTFGYVGDDLAKYLGKSVEQVARAQLKAVLVDFAKVRSEGSEVAEKLHDGSRAALVTKAGELKFALKGSASVEDGVVAGDDVAHGENVAYLPPGMVSVDVDASSASGSVALSPSLTRLGYAPPVTLEFEKGRLVDWSGTKPAPMLEKVLKSVAESNRTLSLLTLGLNEALGYGYGQDRFVSGSASIAGFGFVGIVRDATLKVDGSTVVSQGRR